MLEVQNQEANFSQNAPKQPATGGKKKNVLYVTHTATLVLSMLL